MKRLIGAMLVVTLAVLGARIAYQGLNKITWFNLNEVRVNCPEHVMIDDVIKTSKLRAGESIFHQDIKYAGNVLLALPGIEAVKINRKLPNVIEIDLITDKVELLARCNKIYGLTLSLKLVDIKNFEYVLPVVTGLSGSKNLNNSDRLKLGYALKIYDNLKSVSKSLTERLSEIHFCGNEKIELFFNPGGVKVMIHLRSFDQALTRLSVLEAKGILGNSGSFDMTAGRMIIRLGV